MAKRLSVAVCESNRLFRDGVASLLKEAKYRILASVSDLRELDGVSFAGAGDCLIIVGEQASGSFDLERVAELKRVHPEAHVVLLISSYFDEQRWQAERIGVDAVLLKTISREALLRSLELVLMGEHVFSSNGASTGLSPTFPAVAGPERENTAQSGAETVRPLMTGPGRLGQIEGNYDLEFSRLPTVSARREGLSDRELEILNCLVSGHSNKVIARRCNITESTVKVHLKAILRKIRVANRTQAAVWAMDRIRMEGPSNLMGRSADNLSRDNYPRTPGRGADGRETSSPQNAGGTDKQTGDIAPEGFDEDDSDDDTPRRFGMRDGYAPLLGGGPRGSKTSIRYES